LPPAVERRQFLPFGFQPRLPAPPGTGGQGVVEVPKQMQAGLANFKPGKLVFSTDTAAGQFSESRTTDTASPNTAFRT
jgi:hypothetical protein